MGHALGPMHALHPHCVHRGLHLLPATLRTRNYPACAHGRGADEWYKYSSCQAHQSRDNHQNPISLDGILQHRCPVSHMGAAKDTARCTATVMHRTSTCSRVKVPRHVLHACVRYSRQCRNVPAKSGAKRYHLLHSLLKALNAAMLKLSIIQGVLHALPEPSLKRDSCLMMSRQHCHGSAMGTGKTLTGCRAS